MVLCLDNEIIQSCCLIVLIIHIIEYFSWINVSFNHLTYIHIQLTLNNARVRGTNPGAVENLHMTSNSHKTKLSIAYCQLQSFSWTTTTKNQSTHILYLYIYMVCPEGIQTCNMKNKKFHWKRYKKHCTWDNDTSVPF